MEQKALDSKAFEHKVRSMTAGQIIMAMVEGLRKPATFIDMHTYGKRDSSNICYGCAATNCIANIMHLNEESIVDYIPIAGVTGGGFMGDSINGNLFIDYFEFSIDYFRRLRIDRANDALKAAKLPSIKNKPGLYLSYLDDNYTKEDLKKYEELARYQDEIGNTKTSYDILKEQKEE